MVVHSFVRWFLYGAIQMTTLLRLRRKVTSNLYSSIFHQIYNLKYSRHIKITSCVGLSSFIFVINLTVMLSFNVFNSLIYVFKYKYDQ